MILSIVVPTFNEVENIEFLYSEVRKSLQGIGYEIVLVDDNSPDKTWFRALQFVEDGDVVIRRINLKGLSTAILDGILFSLNSYVVVMDADLQHPPMYIRDMLERMQRDDADVVIASRYAKGGGVEGWSKIRLMISRSASLLAKLLLPSTRGISDPMSGFFMVKRGVVVANRHRLSPRGYKILLEILEKCRVSRVSEIPYVFKPRVRGKSKLGLKTIVEYLIHLLELSGWRPVKFGVVGALGAVVNLGTLILIRLLYPILVSEYFFVGSIVGIETSTLFNFVLHELWTFRDRRGGSALVRLLLFHLTIFPGILSQYIVANALFYGLSIPYILSQFIGILIGFPLNYILSELGIWVRRS